MLDGKENEWDDSHESGGEEDRVVRYHNNSLDDLTGDDDVDFMA